MIEDIEYEEVTDDQPEVQKSSASGAMVLITGNEPFWHRARDIKDRWQEVMVLVQNGDIEIPYAAVAEAQVNLKGLIADIKTWWADLVTHIDKTNA